MTNVFLAPCDSPNFERTVQSSVDLTEHSASPSSLNGHETVRFWGAGTGNRNESNFEKMEPGDLVLFYEDGEYVGTAWVEQTFEDEDGWASETFWDDAESYRIFTISEFEPVSVPKEKVNRIFDYTDGYNPAGLMRVNESNVTKQPAAIKLALTKVSQ